MEQTLLILKPDTVQRRLIGEVIGRLEKKGLQLVAMKMMTISRELAEQHYGVHKGKPFYDSLLTYIISGPVVAMVVEGNSAVAVTRSMMGATFGSDAAPGTIRGDLSISNGFNLIHGSDSPETAKKEVELFFSPDEICSAPLDDMTWVYDHSSGTPE